jgi:hypothetical protein
MDAVYPLGHNSPWGDRELIYSLRSLDRYARGIRRVVIVGAPLPPALGFEVLPWPILHLPARDLTCCKETNIVRKVLQACNTVGLSQEFLFCNDDHFFLQDFDALTLPFYAQGTLAEKIANRSQDSYRAALVNTADVLTEERLPTHYFDVHCPIRYDKAAFRDIMAGYDWTRKRGYVVKSLYANTNQREPTPFVDLKIDSELTTAHILDRLVGRWVFSVGDRGLTPAMKSVLATLYGEIS